MQILNILHCFGAEGGWSSIGPYLELLMNRFPNHSEVLKLLGEGESSEMRLLAIYALDLEAKYQAVRWHPRLDWLISPQSLEGRTHMRGPNTLNVAGKGFQVSLNKRDDGELILQPWYRGSSTTMCQGLAMWIYKCFLLS